MKAYTNKPNRPLNAQTSTITSFPLWSAALTLGAVAVGSYLLNRQTKPPSIDPTTDFTDFGFTRQSMATPSGQMNYYEAGQGQPLLFLHGIGGGASSWYWTKVAPAFVHRYRVIVPDWVGWGLSDHPAQFILFDDYVAALRELLHTLDQPALVVAQGLSGGFAAALAQEEPSLFAQLILWSATGGKDFGEDSFKPLARAILTPIAKRPTLNLWFYRLWFHRPAILRAWFTRRGFYNPRAVSDAIVDGSLYSSRQPRAAYSALPFISGDLRFDIVPYLEEIPVPTSMFWGEAEKQITPQIRQKLAAVNPQIRQITLPRARSNPELELPGQTVALLEQLFATVWPTQKDKRLQHD